MKIAMMNDKMLQLDDCSIIFKNFSGKAGMYNKEGDKNFCIKVDEELISQLENCKNKDGKGWNVKLYTPKPDDKFKDKDLTPFHYLKVKIGNGNIPVQIEIDGVTSVCQDITSLDGLHIDHADVDLSAYDGIVNGAPFRAAYLKGMKVYATRSSRFDTIGMTPSTPVSNNATAPVTPQEALGDDYENLDNVEIV